MRLDFSQWHPLDHWPGTKRCQEHYGGWKHHLVIAWDFHRKDQVISWLWRPLCLFGKHRMQIWCRTMDPVDLFKPSADDQYTAICGCGYSRPATRQEIAEKWKVEM